MTWINRISLAATLLTALVCLLGSPTVLPAPSAEASAASPDAIVKRINSVRRARHLPIVRTSPSLRRSARRYASDMVRGGYFAHLRRIRASGRFNYLGEVLARASRPPTAAWTVRAWMRSPTHRAVLTNRRYRWVGIGRRGGSRGNMVVGHFGAR